MNRIGLAFIAVLFLLGCASDRPHSGPAAKMATARKAAVQGSFGTYNAPPRLKNGRVDIERLLSEVTDLGANTYHWLVWHNANDWTDLQNFLPLARKKNINVWVTVVPPSESPPHTKSYSEPFRLDYIRWAEEIAKLSRREPNLVAWSIDDFTHNLKLFTPAYVAQMNATAHAINPKLAFVPCCYFKSISPAFGQNYKGVLDGVLFPYRAESAGGNLKDPTLVEAEIKLIRERFGPGVPVILDIYATAHSRLGSSKPEYVDRTMEAGRPTADGVHIYCHQDPVKQPEKFAIIRKHFRRWASERNW